MFYADSKRTSFYLITFSIEFVISRLLNTIIIIYYGICVTAIFFKAISCRISFYPSSITVEYSVDCPRFSYRSCFHLTKKPFNETDYAKNVPRRCHATDQYLVRRVEVVLLFASKIRISRLVKYGKYTSPFLPLSCFLLISLSLSRYRKEVFPIIIHRAISASGE